MVTIKDIAQAAGVSFSTVSKALRDSPLVQNETKRRILKLAAEMGYEPNSAARRLVSKRSGAVGVVWPSIERTALSTLITRVNAKLERRGCATLLSINEMHAAIATFRRFQVDAILVFGDTQASVPQDPGAARLDIPVLAYGTAGHLPFPTVDVDRGGAIRLAVRHLAALGHRRIAYVGRPEPPDPLQEVKVSAFHDETARHGLLPARCPVSALHGMEVHDGYAAAKTLLALAPEVRPTAFVSGSYDLTRGILRAAAEDGLSVPAGISVVSYDNIPQMAELDVPMTAVGADVDAMAERIAAALLALVDSPAAFEAATLEPELVIRASTAPPADADYSTASKPK